MTSDVRFIHLTDLHVGDPAQPDPHLYSDTGATLRQILGLVGVMEQRPSFIVASGDLTNRGDAQSFRALKKIFAEIDLPVIYALGNHDSRPGFHHGMHDRSEGLDAALFYDQVIDGIHIIVLDSSSPGKVSGSIGPEQFAWLEGVLDTHQDLPKLIVCHHPPALGTGPDWDHWRTVEYSQSQKLAALLKGRNILAILSGHIHHDRVSFWHGVPVIVGTGQHAATDILYTQGLRMVSAAGFGVGTIRPSGLTMAFVPLPATRAELNLIPYERMIAAIRAREEAVAAE